MRIYRIILLIKGYCLMDRKGFTFFLQIKYFRNSLDYRKYMKLNDDTLYLPIKQVYFDQIIDGKKKEEYREIKEGITANRYLQKVTDNKGRVVKGEYVKDEAHTDPNQSYFIDDYNNGHFPFKPYPYKKLYLAVGYNKERDTALVEVDGYRFIPNMIRAEKYAFWQIAYHIGKVLEVHREGVNESFIPTTNQKDKHVKSSPIVPK